MEKRDANEFLLEALLTGDVSQAIMNQEKRGQDDLNRYDVLPRDMGDQAQYEQIGIVFGEPIDDLFIQAKLPQGWKKVPTDHSMWSRVLDDKGRERINIFYKAAFYDRSAHMHLNMRFHIRTQPVGGFGAYVSWEERQSAPRVALVLDGETVVYETTPTMPGLDAIYDLDNELALQAKVWLVEHYPDWKNPVAYWD